VTVQNTDLDWTVVVHQPTSEAFAFVEAISLYGRLATVAGMTFIVLIGAAIGLSTTRSINRLRYLAEQLQAGDLDVDVYSPRIDSIGELYVGSTTCARRSNGRSRRPSRPARRRRSPAPRRSR